MDEWTREQVEERLVEAADVLKRLPEPRVQGYFSLWPKIAYESATSSARSRGPRAGHRHRRKPSAAWKRP